MNMRRECGWVMDVVVCGVQTIQTHMLSMMSELLRGEYKMVFDMWDRCALTLTLALTRNGAL